MKLVLASTVLLAGVAYAENSGSIHSSHDHDRRRARSMARLKALQQLTATAGLNGGGKQMLPSRDLSQLFDEFDVPSTCGAQCTDPDLCASYSFMSVLDDLSLNCNAGCIPKFELTNCDWLCNQDGTATSSSGPTVDVHPGGSASSPFDPEEEFGGTAEQKKRMGMLDDLVCDQCKFYRCCISDEATTTTKYESCMHYIPTIEDMMPDGMSMEEWESMMTDEEMPNIIMEPMDWEDGEVPRDDSPEWGHGSDNDAVAVPVTPTTTTESATGLTIFGQVVDKLECPGTCSNPEICETILEGEPSLWDMEVACNSGCLPPATSCEEYCGDAWPEIACNSCNFFQCCGEQKERGLGRVETYSSYIYKSLKLDLTGDAGGVKFHTCQEFFPELESLLPTNDWEHAGYDDHNHIGSTDIDHSMDFLDEWADSLQCPDSCLDTELCELFLETGDTVMLKDAFSSGCVPIVSSCDDICGNHDGSEFMAAVFEMACQACFFLECLHSHDDFNACQEFVPDLDKMMPDEFDGHANNGGGDWAVSHSGTVTASGQSVLGEMLGNLECADSCPDKVLCDTFLDGDGDENVLESACNLGCLPVAAGCDEICGNRNEAEYLSSVAEMACGMCMFLECCSGDKILGEEKFNVCEIHLLAMGSVPATGTPADGAAELGVSPEESNGETADVAPSSDVVSDTSADILVEDNTSSDDPSSDASESSDNTLANPSPDANADSTTAAGEDTPDNNLPSGESFVAGLDPETNSTTEISESTDSDLLDSGSYKSSILVCIVLPAVALLLLNSF